MNKPWTERNTLNAFNKWALLIIQSLFSFSVAGQNLENFTPLTSSQGLSENNIRSVIQIPDGRMVFVNEGMINLYNGASFNYLHLHENLSAPLSTYRGHHRLYLENSGRLWMKRKGQLMLIDLVKERNEPNLNHIFNLMRIHVPLADFFMDAGHNLWFLTASGQVYLKKQNSDTAIFFNSLRKIANGEAITDLSSHGSTVYFFLQSGAVIGYDLHKKTEVYRGDSLKDQNKGDYQGTTYVISSGQRFYVLRNGTRGILMAFDIPSRTWKRVLETPYTLNTLSVGPAGKVVVSVNSGIWSMNSDFSDLRYHPTLQLADGRKMHTEISTATYDNQGGLWLGTLNKGLLYHNPKSYRLTEINRERFPIQAMKELNITSFAELSPRTLLVGTNHGIFTYNLKSGVLNKWTGIKENVNCFAMLKDTKGNIWLSCAEGLFRYAQGNTRKMNAMVVKKMVQDKSGSCFVVDLQNQLFVLNPDNGRTSPVMVRTNGKVVQVQAADLALREGILYGINATGIFWYNSASKQMIALQFKKNKAFHQLNNYHFSSIAVDLEGRLWIGTQDGLNIWNFKNHTLTELHSEDGMVNNDVKSILFDDHNDAWVTTAYGISKVKIEAAKTGKIRFTNFTKTDGVIGEQFNERASLKLTGGEIAIGGIDGFNLLDPSKYNANIKLKPIFIDLNVQGISIRPGLNYGNTQILDRSVTAGGRVTLNHHQNFFTVQFSGLNYANPSRTAYRYTLAGANDTWHETEPVNGIGSATYTNLDPGKYRLLVRASGDGQQWSTPGPALEITIMAPWWKTWPMLVCYWITGLLLLSGAWYYLNQKRNAKELLRQEKRLNEIKFEFFTNVSHELRTPLTLILTPLEIILKNLEDLKLRQQLQGIYNNAAHLLSMVNQLLDFRRLQTEQENLQPGICDLSESVRLLSEPFLELARSKHIHLQIDAPKSLWLYLDTEKLRIIVNNLLSNTLKFTSAGGTVAIEVKQGTFPDTESAAAIISVQDSGKGIASADLPHIFNRFFQGANHLPGEMKGSGIGLSLVQEYVKLHGGVIDVKSTVGQGTVFLIYLPFDPPAVNNELADVIIEQEGIARQPTKVLIAEDNNELRRLIAGQLRLHYHVIETSDGKEALERITNDAPDLVISDLMMPGMDGLELCLAVKENIHTSHLPFILLTAKGSEQAHLEGFRVKADAYITKPFNMELLLLRVKNLLEMQEKRKAVLKNSIVIPLQLASASEADEKFMSKLLECIERNMANGDYSVEALSSDMHMERSGLYRKVVAVTGQVPSLFIRTIRLKKAAQFLLLRQYPIAKIAEMTGFSSPAYFSKCFQDEFNVKPSEYYATQSSTAQ